MTDKRLEKKARYIMKHHFCGGELPDGYMTSELEERILEALKQVQTETARDCAEIVRASESEGDEYDNCSIARAISTKYGLKEGK